MYKNLYNSVGDQEEVKNLYHKVDSSIDLEDLKDVRKVSASKVKEAIQRLNNNKSDPVYKFSSDCLKNGPEILFEHLSTILQALLIHGHVSLYL